MNEKNSNKDGQARELKGGEWYWIHRAVIQDHAADIGTMGIAVYNVLASMADSNQECFPSQQYIADCLGYSRATVNRAIKVLLKHGLIGVEKRSQYHCVYQLLKVRCRAGETEMSNRGNRDVLPIDTNKNQLTKINNNIVGIKKSASSDFAGNTELLPDTREGLLAFDIATGLEDFRNLSRYRSLAKRYPEHLLRRTLSESKAIPDRAIRKTRAALFYHLLKNYA